VIRRAARPLRTAFAVVAAAAPLLATSTRERAHSAGSLRTITVRAGNLTLRAVRAGQGTPLVLLHGYGESLLAWREVFQLLSRQADVIAFDLPGFGLSTKPSTGYAVDSIAATVVRALDALSVPRAVLVGHSLGGAIATAVAITYPDRVRALVLIDPAVVAAWVPSAAARAESGRVALRAIADYEELRVRFSGVHDTDWLLESDSALAYSPAADPAYHIALQAVLREFDFSYVTAERAARLHVPTLVLWGQYDPVIPLRSGKRFAAALPAAQFDVVARSWHRPHEERPADVAARIAAFVNRAQTTDRRLAP
jgi:pimeloyl-ACP methyl ester carboxylesterase